MYNRDDRVNEYDDRPSQFGSQLDADSAQATADCTLPYVAVQCLNCAASPESSPLRSFVVLARPENPDDAGFISAE